jgi:predicted metal-binding membrane protein
MWPRVSDRRAFTALLVALIALAWLSLWAWGRSPYGRFLSHEEVGQVQGLGDEYVAVIVLFVAAWTLMTVAMMLPTSLPLVTLFHSFVRKRPNQLRLVALLVAGYLSVWILFGGSVHLADRGLHEVVERVGWLEDNAWAIAATTILLAGAYQFTPLKYHCLDKCRSPLSFIMEHWRGRHDGAQAFRLGVDHGIFCLGCCWSLMLLMFAVGIGNIAWMLVLGIAMAVEKNVPWGRRLSAPLGLLLLAWGLALVLMETPADRIL